MMASEFKTDVSTSLHRSLRNRPSRPLYQPPAQRCADKQLKSYSVSASSSYCSKTQSMKSETHSKTVRLSKLTEHKRRPLCGSKEVEEQDPLAYSRIPPSPTICQEDFWGSSYTKLKSTENRCLSERKPGLGRGNLLKLQLLYEHKYVKANRIDDQLENRDNSDKEDAGHDSNLDKTDPQLSADFNCNNNNNHNHLSKSFLELPDSDSPSPEFHNVTTLKQIENDFKPFICDDLDNCQSLKWQENIFPPSTELQDGVNYVSEEALCEIGREGDPFENISESFGSGEEACNTPGLDISLLSLKRKPRAQNNHNSIPDHNFGLTFSEIGREGDPFENISECFGSGEEACNTPGLDISLLSLKRKPRAQNNHNSIPDHNFGLTLSDLKAATETFYSDEESGDVFDSQASVLSDETYLTVSSHLSDFEEITESISLSTDDFDQDSLLSESNSSAECISEDSSADIFSTPTKTSFHDSHDINKGSLESSLFFQEKVKDITDFADSRDRFHCHAQYQAGDNQLCWSSTRVKNPIPVRECNTLPPKPKSSPKYGTCQMLDLTATHSTKYSSAWSSNSGQKKYFSFSPSHASYQNPASLSPQTLMVGHSVFENSPSCRASSLQSCNMENISKELAKHVSYQQADHRQRHFWPGTKSGDFIIDALRSRVKEICFRNQNHWRQSAFQYKHVFGGIDSWKENYKKKCSEAGHKFLDTHCHIDMMLTEHLDRIYGTFQEYREANADTFPQEFGGCVAIFCNPLTFNPRGSLFRSLVNERNVWISVGCHPKKVKFLDDRTLIQLNECIRMPEVVAVGEIGLDYSGMFYLEADVQKEVFRNQIRLALDVSKPIVIHCREAEDDCFSILKEECPLDWLIHLHCYTLDFGHAQKWLDTFPNLYIGLTPKVTYRNAFAVHDTASKIPLTRLVLESDAPYFIPSMVPYNELRCSHPGLVFTVAEKVAKLQGRHVKEVLKACWDNSHRLYRINPNI